MLPTDLHSKIISESSLISLKEITTQPMTNKKHDDSSCFITNGYMNFPGFDPTG